MSHTKAVFDRVVGNIREWAGFVAEDTKVDISEWQYFGPEGMDDLLQVLESCDAKTLAAIGDLCSCDRQREEVATRWAIVSDGLFDHTEKARGTVESIARQMIAGAPNLSEAIKGILEEQVNNVVDVVMLFITTHERTLLAAGELVASKLEKERQEVLEKVRRLVHEDISDRLMTEY